MTKAEYFDLLKAAAEAEEVFDYYELEEWAKKMREKEKQDE